MRYYRTFSVVYEGIQAGFGRGGIAGEFGPVMLGPHPSIALSEIFTCTVNTDNTDGKGNKKQENHALR
jgi:hypothetical protein